MPTRLPAEVREFLEEGRLFAVVATINADGTPQQTVVWYALRGDELMMNTARGRVKDRNLRRDPRLSITVTREDGYRWVAIRGVARLVDDPAVSQADIYALAVHYDGQEEADRAMREQFSREQRVSIYVPIERFTTYGF
jgi:PPOX class probable F420-dependent enzyme